MQQQNILILDDSIEILRALEHYVQRMPSLSRYQVVGCRKYSDTIIASLYQSADIIMCGLFKRYENRFRAEGIPVLERRINQKRRGLVFGFGVLEVADNPLLWDIASDYTLEEKLSGLSELDDAEIPFQELQKHFERNIFPVDGHQHKG